MRVVVEKTRGDFTGHPTVCIQPVIDADVLGGRSQPWLAFDVMQQHRVPILRVRMFAEPRSFNNEFETTKYVLNAVWVNLLFQRSGTEVFVLWYTYLGTVKV